MVKSRITTAYARSIHQILIPFFFLTKVWKQEEMWALNLWSTSVRVSLPLRSSPAPEGPLKLTRARCNTKHSCLPYQFHHLWPFPLLLSLHLPRNHSLAKLTKRSRIALMKTNVRTWLAPMWPFKSLPLVFLRRRGPLFSIIVIRLIPVRDVTAPGGRRGGLGEAALAVLPSARFS